jgi:hypothetical protein
LQYAFACMYVGLLLRWRRIDSHSLVLQSQRPSPFTNPKDRKSRPGHF